VTLDPTGKYLRRVWVNASCANWRIYVPMTGN